MNSIKRHTPGVLFCGCLHWHWSNFDRAEDLDQLISKDLADSGISRQEFDASKLILSFLEEGHNANVLAPLARHFDRTHPGKYLILNSIDFYRCMVNHGGFLDRLHGRQTAVTTGKFLCLIRRASLSRAKFASDLRNAVPVESVRMSFGSQSHSYELTQYQSFFPNTSLPITLDGVIDHGSMNKIYDVENSWFESAFNIICETSSQTEPEVWKDLFITEKTFKCFAMQQIPVWFAVPGLVQKIRTLGLDLFDDIVDHSYDSIDSEGQRRHAVIKEIARLDQQYSLEQCMDLRKRLWPRLTANYLALTEIRAQHSAEVKHAISQFIAQK